MPVNYKTFIPEVSIDVPGCPDPFLINYIRKAAIEFCGLTHIWKQQITPVPIQNGLAIHDFDLEEGESLITVETAVRTSDGGPVMVVGEELMDSRMGGQDWRSTTGKDPKALIIVNRNQFRLYPIPTAASTGNVELYAVLKPSRASFEVPQWLHEEYVDAIADGAKKLLLAMPKRPWFDPKMVPHFTTKFNNAVGIAKSASRKSYGTQTLFAPLIKI